MTTPVTDDRKWHELLQKRIFLRLLVPMLWALGMLGLVIYDVYKGEVSPIQLPWLLPGVVLGVPFGVLTKVVWADGQVKVKGDKLQFLLIAVYIAVRFGSRYVLSNTLGEVSYIGDIALLLTSGTLIGRSLGLAWKVRRVLLTRYMTSS